MSTKTLQISIETHKIILKKWVELKDKGIDIRLFKVAEAAILAGIDKVEEQLKLLNKEL
jgi:hypothetical protein